MKALLRTLLLWFLLAAVPLQGFASATMLLCAPQPAPAMHEAMPADGPHDHAAMLAAQHVNGAVHHDGAHHQGALHDPAQHDFAHHDPAHHDPAHHDPDTSHAEHAKCASAGACCTGAPLAPAPPAAPALQDGRCATVPFVPAAPAAVDLAGLERPPKSAPA
jgi:hypothetical protein